MKGISPQARHLATCALAALTATPALAIDAQIDVSVQSDVAPLAVFFDGRGTSDPALSGPEVFLDVGYEWDFGDTACETPTDDVWVHSGRSRCHDHGPVAGHVYETPGTFMATLTVERRGFPLSFAQVQITVQDPAVVFAGQSTVCVSQTGDFSDPDGVCDDANLVTSTGSFESILGSHLGDGKRVLFHRGESWAATGDYSYGSAGPAIVGAYGAGAKPQITLDSQRVFRIGGSHRSLRVIDLDFRGSDDPDDGSVFFTSSSGQAKEVLFLRVDVRDVAKPFQLGVNGGPQPQTGYMNDSLSIVDSTSISRPFDSGNNDFFGGGERMLFMGNDFGDADGGEHTLRFQYLKGAVISHNSIGRMQPKDKHVIKMHNIFDGSPCTEEVMIADNRADAGGASNALDLGPPNGTSIDECVRLVRVERNHVVMSGPTSHRQIAVRGGENLVANNILDLSGANPVVRPFGVLLGKRSSAQIQSAVDNRVFNNTCYMSNGGSGAKCVSLSGSGNDSIVMNNVIYAPNLDSGAAVVVEDLGSGNTLADNRVVYSNPFITSTPSLASDFQLGAGAAGLIDEGTLPSSNLSHDFTGINPRQVGSGVDIGAYEDGS